MNHAHEMLLSCSARCTHQFGFVRTIARQDLRESGLHALGRPSVSATTCHGKAFGNGSGQSLVEGSQSGPGDGSQARLADGSQQCLDEGIQPGPSDGSGQALGDGSQPGPGASSL